MVIHFKYSNMCVSIPYSLTIPYYSAIKKNEIVPFAAMWMELEIVILSEVSQMEKVKYHIIYTKNLKKKMIQRDTISEVQFKCFL